MNMNYLIAGILFFSFSFSAKAQEKTERAKAIIKINTDVGHPLPEGSSGFNVRIADKVWNFTHPDFKAAVHLARPGWLRYFSGTMGDAFNSATGQYDLDYAWMFDHQEQYIKGYEFTEVKGPHRVSDLYNLLGEVGGKLVITVNGFSETPDIVAELARFCKNNNIVVEAWQFCNEPYFYVPHRERYWWNDGYDYAAKMKPYADSILQVFPDAKLALNFTWDGIWGFMKEINKYQNENGRYWNVFSKHSYAPHIGGSESFESAYRRANTKLIQATGPAAMAEIEEYAWKGAPLMITEFGIWNRALDGIFSGVYNVEYTLRQLSHPNAFLIGSHEISGKFRPVENRNNEIVAAFREGRKIDADTMRTGVEMSEEGKALKILHEATNHADYAWKTSIEGGVKVPGMKDAEEESLYALAFRGTNGYDYLAVTNRSSSYHDAGIFMGTNKLSGPVERSYIFAEDAKESHFEILNDKISGDRFEIPPFSVTLFKWPSDRKQASSATRIYRAVVTGKGASLSWWKKDGATGYILKYGDKADDLNKIIRIKDHEKNAYEIKGLKSGSEYYFSVSAVNDHGESVSSNAVKLKMEVPAAPIIFKTARRDTTITVFWRSVPDATGYKVRVDAKEINYRKEYDAKNVFGFRFEGLQYDVPYRVVVVAYNGKGESVPSESVVVVPRKELPIPPMNISATETGDGDVFLEWIVQDTINPGVKYKLFRGSQLHQFEEIASGIEGNNYTDKSAGAKGTFYYTVKSYNHTGECNFHPNIATVIKSADIRRIEVVNVKKLDDRYRIKVKFENIPLDGDHNMGVSISDISYLTVEEELVRAQGFSENAFEVDIPAASLRKGRTYAIRGFVETNGKAIYSDPPHKQIIVE